MEAAWTVCTLNIEIVQNICIYHDVLDQIYHNLTYSFFQRGHHINLYSVGILGTWFLGIDLQI